MPYASVGEVQPENAFTDPYVLKADIEPTTKLTTRQGPLGDPPGNLR